MMELESPQYIFSGFGNTYLVNINSRTYGKVIADFEQSCYISSSDTPFYSRLFIYSDTQAFYYCPAKNLLYILDPSNNFAVQANQITLTGASTFNEVKFLTSKKDPNTLFILGLTSVPAADNVGINKYTSSFLVKVDLGQSVCQSVSAMTGAHGEPIVQIQIMLQDEVIAIGEQMYQNHIRLNTYYIGQLTDKSFNRVVDFYMAYSPAFIPQVKITSDFTYIIYTSEKSIFRYERMSGKIIQYTNVTFTQAQFKQGDVEYSWGNIPFTISNSGKQLYVYNQGGFVTLDIHTMNQVSYTPVPFSVSNTTDCQVFFLKDGNTDEALFQADSNTVLIPFGASKTTTEDIAETFVKKMKGFLEAI